jgi:hypothetical protein
MWISTSLLAAFEIEKLKVRSWLFIAAVKQQLIFYLCSNSITKV